MDDKLIDFRVSFLAEISAQAEGDADGLEERQRLLRHFLSIAESSGNTTEDWEICEFDGYVGRSRKHARIDAYAILDAGEDEPDAATEIQLFISHFEPDSEMYTLSPSLIGALRDQATLFYAAAIRGDFAKLTNVSSQIAEFAEILHTHYKHEPHLVRIILVTDGYTPPARYPSRKAEFATAYFEIFNIERVHRAVDVEVQVDDLIYDIEGTHGQRLPTFYTETPDGSYAYALTALPASSLIEMYERYGQRLLESNVRAFLKLNRATNKGMSITIREQPGLFTAYNNGLVIVADEIVLKALHEGQQNGVTAISQIINPRIVNGGQTTATLFHTKMKFPQTDVSAIWVPAKIIVPRSVTGQARKDLISKIAEFANSQSAIKKSDLSSSHPFHVLASRAAENSYLPDGEGKWFYERTLGSYDAMLQQLSSNKAEFNRMKLKITPKARVVKKTELVKALACWEGEPHQASLGNEKNLVAYFKNLDAKLLRDRGIQNRASDDGDLDALEAAYKDYVTTAYFKQAIATHILMKRTMQIVRQQRTSGSPGVIANYTVAILAEKYSSRIDLMAIWRAQNVPASMAELVSDVGREVAAHFKEITGIRNPSEVAKKEVTWREIKTRMA